MLISLANQMQSNCGKCLQQTFVDDSKRNKTFLNIFKLCCSFNCIVSIDVKIKLTLKKYICRNLYASSFDSL